MKLLGTYSPGSNRLSADLSGRFSDRGPLLLLMRHGQILSPVGGRRFIGQTDLPLDETGEVQARAWQPVFREIPLSGIYVSGLERTVRTAALCCPGRPVIRDGRIREIDLGTWENRGFCQIRSEFPDAFEARGRDIAGFRPPGGESFSDLFRRAAPFFGDLAGFCGHTLVITHAGVIRVMRCFWGGLSLDRLLTFRPACGEVSLFGAGGDDTPSL